jgi:hypothetical protein
MLVKQNITKGTLVFIAIIITSFANSQSKQSSLNIESLYTILAAKDSTLFNAAFTTCNTSQIENLLGKEFVFYHDNGYSNKTTNDTRTVFLENIRNFCEKKSKGEGMNMRRDIVRGTLQVHAVNNNEAVQTGVQRFYIITKEQPDQLVEESKFSREWRKENGEWKITRELDYLVNTKFNSGPANSNDLYNEIAHMDSVLFNAFNNRDMEKFKTLFTTDLEFYHDKGGLTDYNYSIQSFASTIAQNNGLKRELVKGSLEVYPIKDYGAIQIGAHTFCHMENGKEDCGTFKFVHLWKKINNEWKITRVISYDH